jgi:trimethylguanosine synthase
MILSEIGEASQDLSVDVAQPAPNGSRSKPRFSGRARGTATSVSPFGPDVQKYWDRRYEYFSKFDEGIQIDREGLFSVMPEDAALALAERLNVSTIVDGFAGVGGSAIGFVRAGMSVTSIDIDADRLMMAANNGTVYGLRDRIAFVHGDFVEAALGIDAEAVHLDPPWGGPSYITKDSFDLADFRPDGNVLLVVSLARFDVVALRIPRNFSPNRLAELSQVCTVHDDYARGRLISRTMIFDRRVKGAVRHLGI